MMKKLLAALLAGLAFASQAHAASMSARSQILLDRFARQAERGVAVHTDTFVGLEWPCGGGTCRAGLNREANLLWTGTR